jgi:hypothetical protein
LKLAYLVRLTKGLLVKCTPLLLVLRQLDFLLNAPESIPWHKHGDGTISWLHSKQMYSYAPSQKLEEVPSFTVLNSEFNVPHAPSTLVSVAFREGSLLRASTQGM